MTDEALIKVVTEMLHEQLEGAFVLVWMGRDGRIRLETDVAPENVAKVGEDISALLTEHRRNV